MKDTKKEISIPTGRKEGSKSEREGGGGKNWRGSEKRKTRKWERGKKGEG